MNKTFTALAMWSTLTSAAWAAPRAPLPPVFTPVPIFTWTGFYAGVNIGYAWNDDRIGMFADPNGTYISPDYTTQYLNGLGAARERFNQRGFTGGGQIGYNYQITPGEGFVIGIEADAAYTYLKNRHQSSFIEDFSEGEGGDYQYVFEERSRKGLDFLGTVRGRLGYAWDRFMIYGTGGFAYGQVSYSSSINETDYFFGEGTSVIPYSTTVAHYSGIQTGYAIGAGVEYALPTDSILNFFRADAVTLKLEYLHYDLGTRTVYGRLTPAGGGSGGEGDGGPVPLIAPIAGTYAETISKLSTEGNLFRVGLNYKFGSY